MKKFKVCLLEHADDESRELLEILLRGKFCVEEHHQVTGCPLTGTSLNRQNFDPGQT